MKNLLSLLCVLALFSCQEKHEPFVLEQFAIIPQSLEPGEEVILHYAYFDKESSCYAHLIVERMSSGDTVNVLTHNYENIYTADDYGKVYNYLNPDLTKIIQSAMIRNDQSPNFITNGRAADPYFNCVGRDVEEHPIARNGHPSVFGSLALINLNNASAE